MLEFLYPYEMQFGIQSLLEEVRAYNQTTRQNIAAMGLDSLQGYLQLTTDPDILKSIDITQMQSTGISKFENAKMD